MKINWKTHLVELGVVFVGITLAFMLEEWRDTRIQSTLERKYLQSFQHELAMDKVKLDSLVQRSENTSKNVHRLQDLLVAGKVNPDTVTTLFAGAMAFLQLPRNRSTYVSVTGSGNLSLIADYEVRQALIEYYQLLDSSELGIQVSNDYLERYIIPLFVDHLDFISGAWSPPGVVEGTHFRNLVVGCTQLMDQNIEAYHNIQTKRDALAGRVDSVLANP